MRPVATEVADGVFHVGRPGTNRQPLVEGEAWQHTEGLS